MHVPVLLVFLVTVLVLALLDLSIALLDFPCCFE